ncbi:OprD family outer membrane porin [Sulfurimonas sp.]
MYDSKILSTLLLISTFGTFLSAQDIKKTDAIKANGQLLYNKQKNAQTFNGLFSKGDIYGRIRSNTFYFAYKAENSSHDTQLVSGIGASFIFKSAIYKGFDTNVGLYASQAFFNDTTDPVASIKPGKDTFSRYDYANTGSKSMGVIGQANIGYRYSKSKLTVGRQLVETFYTKSNDTKMIPNTFDGLVLNVREIKNTKLKFVYLQKQKLRDHTTSHAVLMYDDRDLANFSNWNGNDDGAMHRGLTYSALKAYGKPTDAPLIILDGQNNSIKNLKINFSSYLVPELVSQIMGEVNYKIPFKNFSITPALRYIQQFDNGAGKVGGASLYKTGLNGYKNPNSLDAGMIAAKIATRMEDYRLTLAYTGILNKADLVTPWRGFPTAGYTRSMGMYNWRANVKSYRVELVKGANKNGIYTSPFIQTSILYINGDKTKAQTDSIFYYAGIVQNIPTMQALQYRLRLGWRDFIGDSSSVSDYLDSRFELNYLF